MQIKYVDFYKHFVTKLPQGLSSPKKILANSFTLPVDSIVHFISDSEQVYGPDNANLFLRNLQPPIPIYHELLLNHIVSTPQPITINTTNLIRYYHKTNLTFKQVASLDRFIATDKRTAIANYSFLPLLNKYPSTTLQSYHAWLNIRATIWDRVKKIGNSKNQFLLFKIPTYLPSKTDLFKYAESFTSTGLTIFKDSDTLNILELWRILAADIVSLVNEVNDNVLKNVNICFIESGQIVTFNLGELVATSLDNNHNSMMHFYTFLDNMLALRSNVDTATLIKDADKLEEQSANEPIVNITPNSINDLNVEKIKKSISEYGQNGLLSSAEQNALNKLSQKYKVITNPWGGAETLDSMIPNEEDLKLGNTQIAPDRDTIHDKSLLYSSTQEWDKKYIKNNFQKNIIQNILSLQAAGIIVKDVNVKRENTAVTVVDTVTVQVQPVNGPVSTISFKLPVINELGIFMAGGIKYRMDKQVGELPIVKIKPNRVGLTSYYGSKLFVIRNENSSSNIAKYLLKHIYLENSNPDGNIDRLIYGANILIQNKLPRVYTGIAEQVESFTVKDKGFVFFFGYKKLDKFFNPEELELISKSGFTPAGRGKNILLGMDQNGDIYSISDKEVLPLGFIAQLINPDLSTGPLEYSELTIYSKRIPLILAFTYIYGLEPALNKLGIKFEIVPANARYSVSHDVFKLKFNDIAYILKIDTLESKLLVGGFNTVRKKITSHKASDLNKPTIYSSLLSGLGVNNTILKELKLIWDMFIDPITLGLLVKFKEPTTFEGLLIKANELLVNDYVPKATEVRYKGYERIPGMVYKELVTSVRAYRAQGSIGNNPVGMNPEAVWLDILSDETKVLIEESNPIHNIKEGESVTHVGDGGRSSITMVKSTRGFKQSDLGIVSESTPDSSKVGIRYYLTPNANILSVDGVTRAYDETTDGPSSVVSTTALLSASVTKDDGKRVNFISIQHSHGVAGKGYQLMPYRTGYEEIIGYRTSELFCSNSKKDGKVVSIDTKYLKVEYADGSTETFKLGVSHGTATGVTIPHTLVSGLKVGDKFKTGDTLVYNSGFFKPSEMDSKLVSYMSGILARVALIDTSDTIEDGVNINKAMADKLETPSCRLHAVVLDKDMRVYNLLKIGTVVEPDSILCTTENALGDTEMSKNSDALAALTQLAGLNPKAKVYGVISNIEVLYYCDVEDCHPTIQDVIKTYDNVRTKHVKELGTGEAKTGRINETIRVANKKILEGQVVIKIFMDYYTSMNSGDKLVVGNQLKCTVTRVLTTPSTSEDGQVVDADFGRKSITARVVQSCDIMGCMNTCLLEMSYQMGKKYFE